MVLKYNFLAPDSYAGISACSVDGHFCRLLVSETSYSGISSEVNPNSRNQKRAITDKLLEEKRKYYHGLVLHPESGKMYWVVIKNVSDNCRSAIMSATMDGDNVSFLQKPHSI